MPAITVRQRVAEGNFMACMRCLAHLRLTSGTISRFSASFVWQGLTCPIGEPLMDRADTSARIAAVIEPFNKKAVALTDDSTFAGDLEWDSLTVMDFVAAIEDEFDIIISMNQQAEIETYGQLIDAVTKIKG
jgi:acyl carrier protein